jgi:hypothetical protein
LVWVEAAGVDAEGAGEQFAAALGELREDAFERRAAVAGLADRGPWEPELDGVLGENIATCLPFAVAAWPTRKATRTRSGSSIPVARLMTTLLFMRSFLAVRSM